jgi:hypothetical protein
LQPEEARTQINRWVAESTNNVIDSIVAPGSVDSSTRLVATNAIYFKGSWETPFDKESTKEDKFHRLDGSAVDTQFMCSADSQFIGVHDGFKVLRMPYTYTRHRTCSGAWRQVFKGEGPFPDDDTPCASSCRTRVTACRASWTPWRPARASCRTTCR